MERARKQKIALVGSLCVLTLIAGVTAFLTSTDAAANLFHIAEVDLKIEEEFEEDSKLSAGQTITKQPWVTNTGNVEQLFFVEVSVPCMEATFLTTDGQRIVPDGVTPASAADYRQTQEIFDLLADGVPSKGFITAPVTVSEGVEQRWEVSYNEGTTAAPGWIYLEQTETRVEKGRDQGMQDALYDTYLLGYSGWVSPGAKTIPIFDRLRLRSIVDADIDDETLGQVQINAYTIQAKELRLEVTGDGKDTLYTREELQKIWQILENKDVPPPTTVPTETTATP